MKLAKWIACVLFLTLLAAGAFARDYRQELHQTYPLSASGTVNLKNINGDVEILTWDRNEVKVDAVKTADSADDLEEVEIIIRNTPDRIDIKTDYDRSYWRHNHRAASVEYTLTVPRKARLDRIELVNGDLTVEGVEGEAHLSSVNGTVDATGLASEAYLSTVNGRLNAEFSRLGRASLKSVNGTVNLAIPSDSSATIDAETLHGSITNDFGLSTNKHRWVGRSLSGTLKDGAQRVSINTVNGSIRIRKSDL